MTEEELGDRAAWLDIIYTALGLPEAVVNKGSVAAEVVDEWSRIPVRNSFGSDRREAEQRTEAAHALIDKLADELAQGALDALLVRSETISEACERLARRLVPGPQDDQMKQQHLLARLLPALIDVVEPTLKGRAPGPAQPAP